MKSVHFTFRSLPPEYRDHDHWRPVDIDALPDDDRARFLRLKVAIETYIGTGKLRIAARDAGCSGALIIKQLNRCLRTAADGMIWGWAGLLKGVRIKRYRRTAAQPTGIESGQGFAGSFAKFLAEHDDIRLAIDAAILKKGGSKKGHEARISIKNLAEKLRTLCLQHGLCENDYPLNVSSGARRSLGRYVDKLVNEVGSPAIAARNGADAASRLRVATGERTWPLIPAPYDVGGLDAHEIHCIGCVIVTGPAGPQRIAIERLWIICIVDEGSRAILGYSVGIRTEVSSATVEEALISVISRWQPRKLTIPVLSYMEGGGLPSGAIPILAGCFPAVLKLDNAAQHFAHRIAESARKRLGCAVTWGAVSHWEHNAVVERLFKTLETYGFMRLPSTTGSNPTDSRKQEPVEAARKLGITWEGLLDLTDILVANYNATPSLALGGQTPLQVLDNHLCLGDGLFLPRSLPNPTVGQPELGTVVEAHFVRGNRNQGHRPYVQVDRVRYTNRLLAGSFGLVGSSVRLHIHESDMREVTAFLDSGQCLGKLMAAGNWGKTLHTREMRKEIWRLADAGELKLHPQYDPVQSLLEYYAETAYVTAQKRPNAVSRTGTKLARAAHASAMPVPTIQAYTTPDEALADTRQPTRPVPSTIRQPKWKSVT